MVAGQRTIESYRGFVHLEVFGQKNINNDTFDVGRKAYTNLARSHEVEPAERALVIFLESTVLSVPLPLLYEWPFELWRPDHSPFSQAPSCDR